MSIIDQKGKLFGKLNVIDLIAILLILAVVALLGYKLTSNTDIASQGQTVTYTVLVRDVRPEVYENVQKEIPGQLMAASELLDGQVTQVTATPTEGTTYTIRDIPGVGTTLTTVETGNLDLVFTIEATLKDSLTSALGTQEIRVGKSHIVKTTTFELDGGVILTCDRPEEADSAQGAE